MEFLFEPLLSQKITKNIYKYAEKSYNNNMENYFEKRSLSNIERTNRIKEELPYFCEEFFVGIENRTTPLTRLNYAYDLRIFFQFLSKKVFRDRKGVLDITLNDLNELDSSDIELFISSLSLYEINGKKEHCTERGKARKLATIRSFFKFFFNKNKLDANVAAKVAMPKLHEKEIIRLENNGKVDEVAAILSTAESGNGLTPQQQRFHARTQKRDVAILTLFLGTGIRISELVGLNVEDIDFKANSFVVTRKGGNRAILYFNDEVRYALEIYLEEQSYRKERRPDEHALFLSLQGTRIGVRSVENLVKKYAQIVSPLKKITPHKLRSTFGTNLYRATGDIYVVADCLGHKDINTTKKHYAATSEEIRKKAARSVTLRNE